MKALPALLLILLLVACSASESTVLPTAFNLDSSATSNAATQAAAVSPTPTATEERPRSAAPTLPPTWTPSAAQADDVSDDTQPIAQAAGSIGDIFYIFDGDAVVRLRGDGSGEDIIVQFGINQPISDLTLSPDGSLLAYVAPGNGSAREVFISNREGTYRQQVSCLGFADVRQPTWSPDGGRIAFLAAQSRGLPLRIYSAGWVGSSNCPTENDQRRLGEIESAGLGDLVYDPAGERLFFSNGPLYVLDLADETVSRALTPNSPGGSDFNLAFSPPDLLFYLRREENAETLTPLGSGFVIDVADINRVPQAEAQLGGGLHHVMWGADRDVLLASTLNSVFLYNIETNQRTNVLSGLALPPGAVLSPDGSQIAYIDADPDNPLLPQIYFAPRNGFGTRQVTFHDVGTISNLIWAGG